MTRILFTAAAILFAVFLLSACERPSASRELPPDWPVPKLTLDPDWVLLRKATAMHVLDPVKYPDPEWIVIFESDDTWLDVVAHVESCLKPLGWRCSRHKGGMSPIGLDLPETRTYYAPDWLTEVVISNGVYIDILADANVEFAMDIHAYEKPPELIQSILDHNVKRPGSNMGTEILDIQYPPIE